jgi:hypothetical protein
MPRASRRLTVSLAAGAMPAHAMRWRSMGTWSSTEATPPRMRVGSARSTAASVASACASQEDGTESHWPKGKTPCGCAAYTKVAEGSRGDSDICAAQ